MGPLSFDVSSILGWLFDSTIYISILICLILAIKSIIRRKLPAWWSYGLWLLLVFRMLIPWGVESRVSVFNYVPAPPENELYMPFLMEQELNIPFLSYDTETLSSTGIDLKNNSTDERIDNKDSNRSSFNLSLGKVLLVIWFAGVIIFSIAILFKNLKFWMRIKRGSPINDKIVIDVFENCRKSLAIRKNVSVIVTAKVKSPALFGYFKPRLLLPPHLLDTLEEDGLRCVFFHELCHLKRHDIGVYWFTTVLQIIHWFNPLVWYALYHMRVDQEAACDAYVLLKLKRVQPVDYANTIVDLLERFVHNRQLPSLAGIIENKSQISRRIAMILNYKRNTLKMTFVLFLMLFVVGMVFFTSSGSKADAKKSEIAVDHKEIQSIRPIDGQVSSRYENSISHSENENVFNEVVIPTGLTEKTAIENVVEVSQTQTTAKKMENQEEPLLLALNEEKVSSSESKLQKIDKAEPEQEIEQFEAVQQRQNAIVDYTARGRSYLKKGQIDDALSDLNKAIELNYENAVTYFSRGNAYYIKGQIDKAISDYDKAIEINPRYTNAYFSRGFYYQAIEDYSKAISDYNKAISIHPENTYAYDYRGSAYFAQEQHQKAFDDFSKAIELDPGYANAYVNRGYIHHVIRSEYKNAVADYSKAIELNPEDAVAHHFRGSAYLSQIQYDDALSDYDKAIELNPGYHDAYISRGCYYLYTKRFYNRAIDDFNEAIQLNPEDAVAKRLRRDAYVRLDSMTGGVPGVNAVPTFFKDNNQITNAY